MTLLPISVASLVVRSLAFVVLGAAAPAQAPADDASPAKPEPRADADQAGADDEPVAPPATRGGADPSGDAFRFGSPPQLEKSLTEEDMWPAATADGWKRPVLVQWQRSFDDAMRVARERNMPLMVCVNMDGEIASEHFAGVRYREPQTAAQMARYVCVIASVYRHTPRDYDELGRRVPCPRFGTVTCGEHIDAERELYGKYFDGRRISPRHIVLDLEGNETFDVYYSWDTQTVFTAFVAGVEGWPEPTPPQERSIEGLTKSADVADRLRLEKIYVSSDDEVRRRILRTLATEHVVDQTEVLRSAIFGLDLELSTLARQALAQCETDGALDLMAEALKVNLPDSERAVLLQAVERLAPSSKRARALLALHQGMPAASPLIDASKLELVAREYESSAGSRSSIGTLEAASDSVRADTHNGAAQVALAEALLARANAAPLDPLAELWMRDALTAAYEAERNGQSGPRVDAIIAVVKDALGDPRMASERAIRAVEGGLLLPANDQVPAQSLDPTTLNRVVRLFADARRRSIYRAYRRGDEWPPEWLSDVNGAYAVLIEAQIEDESVLVEHYDFLRWIGATPRAGEVLATGLERFPDSPTLHERLRARVLWKDGPSGLEREYAKRLAQAATLETPSQLTWFAGYAALIAAEHWRQRSEFVEAGAAYQRSIDRFEQSANDFPDGFDSCAHYAALSEAGLARLALQTGELERATELLLAAIARRPASAETQDGLGLSPLMTAKMLKARLAESDTPERATALQAAIDRLLAQDA